jgi:uncharacterized protein YkwD
VITFRISVALAAAIVVSVSANLTTPRTGAQGADCAVSPAELSIDAEEQAALDAINALRAAAGLAPVALSPALGQAAAHKSQAMAGTGLFSHNDADGRTFARRTADCGYRASPMVSETIATGLPGGRAIAQMWRDSPAHHVILTDPANRAIGIARVRDAGGTYWWTAVFAPVLDAAVPTTPSPVAPTAAQHGPRQRRPWRVPQHSRRTRPDRRDRRLPRGWHPRPRLPRPDARRRHHLVAGRRPRLDRRRVSRLGVGVRCQVSGADREIAFAAHSLSPDT